MKTKTKLIICMILLVSIIYGCTGSYIEGWQIDYCVGGSVVPTENYVRIANCNMSSDPFTMLDGENYVLDFEWSCTSGSLDAKIIAKDGSSIQTINLGENTITGNGESGLRVILSTNGECKINKTRIYREGPYAANQMETAGLPNECCPFDYCWNPILQKCVEAVVSASSTIAECSDGIDNNDDDFFDYSDKGCVDDGYTGDGEEEVDCNEYLDDTNEVRKGDDGCLKADDWTENDESSLSIKPVIDPDANSDNVIEVEGDETKAYICTLPNANPRDPTATTADWLLTTKKLHWDKSASGFCPQNTCFFSSGNDENPIYPEDNEDKCVPNGFIKNDHICHNGNWTTRTSFIAQKMIGYAGNDDYTLFCDDFMPPAFGSVVDSDYYKHYALNYIQPLIDSGAIGSGHAALSRGEFDAFNNFCILIKQDGEVLIGSSSNLGPTDVDNKRYKNLDTTVNDYDQFLKLFSVYDKYADTIGYSQQEVSGMEKFTFCDDAFVDIDSLPADEQIAGKFRACDTNQLWFNKELNAFIFSANPVNLEPSIFGVFIDLLDFDTILLLFDQNSDFVQKVANSQDYDRLYIYDEQALDKRIAGIVEKTPKEVLTVTYKNFDPIDICSIIETEIPNDEHQINVFCEADGSLETQTVIINDYETFAPTLAQKPDIWPDLTAKLRPSQND